MVCSLAISPCPNDTFSFYGLLHGKTSFAEEIRCEFKDIEALNQSCIQARFDFCKISFHAFLRLSHSHWMLDSGAALGFGCGPLIVVKNGSEAGSLSRMKIAVPGENTTAYLLLRLYAGSQLDTVEMPFDRILSSVANGEVDAGLIIHESRFTYQEYGLSEMADLGAWWEKQSGHAIPLGGIVASRTLEPNRIHAFQQALKDSIDFAWNHQDEVLPFMREHAQEMDLEIMMRHVELYVNQFTRSLGQSGRASIHALMKASLGLGAFVPDAKRPLFFPAS